MTTPQFKIAILILLFSVVCVGCTRRGYRIRADRQANELISSRQIDPSWQLPPRNVMADPKSRLADRRDPDCGPRPPDDPASKPWMDRPYGMNNTKYWNRIRDDAAIDNGQWANYLPTNEHGAINLTRDNAMGLALLHARDYQEQYDELYFSALELSNSRFNFDTQFFSGTRTDYFASGDGASGTRLLTKDITNGLRKNFASGGQFLATLANQFSWDLVSNNVSAAGGSLIFAMTQPLLRGAFRYVQLEELTLAERNLLYLVRGFARFRRQFYLDITSEYLGLLAQSQGLKNQRANLTSLDLNLREHRAMFEKEMVPQIQVDQVFQQYQSGRIGVLDAEQSLQDSLDQFKFSLGLPPYLQVQLDESLLKQFELNDPELDKIQSEIDAVFLRVLQFLPPDEFPKDEAENAVKELEKLERRLAKQVPLVVKEWNQWKRKLDLGLPKFADEDEKLDFEQQLILSEDVKESLDTLEEELSDLDTKHERRRTEIETLVGDDKWKRISDEIGKRLRKLTTRSFIAQTQTRLFLIEITRVNFEQESAVETALQNRLDLMNQRAIVTDAFRQVEFAADRLQSDLSINGTANIATDPNKKNAIGFDSSANTYNLNVQFDGPLNRRIERNGYRAAQVFYQQARRNYMATEDIIANQIRSDLRRLRINWLNFQISRQQLIVASRQVDEAQFNLRSTTQASSNLTRDLLGALARLLDAKNSLIRNWFDYEISRIALFVDLELLYLDEQGVWTNDHSNSDPANSVFQQESLSEFTPANSSPQDLIRNSLERRHDGSKKATQRRRHSKLDQSKTGIAQPGSRIRIEPIRNANEADLGRLFERIRR